MAGQLDESKYSEDERFKALRAQSLDARICTTLVTLFDSSVLTPEDADERVVELLRLFRVEHALRILSQLQTANLIGVQNRATFLMALMRNFKDRLRQIGADAAIAAPLVNGPSVSSLQAILDRTGYSMEVTIGQRKYGGPPPSTEEEAASETAPGNEIYIGHIPKDTFEDELIPLFEEFGRIWDLRIMMDPMTGFNRGYGFVTYCDKQAAKKAAEKFDGYEIKKGKKLKVNVSVANTRLFLGNIPKSKTKDEILTELQSLTEGVHDVIVYTNTEPSSNRKNRGFCFVDFNDHKTASDAKRRLTNGRIRPWNCDLVVDWAESQEEPDDETMAKVKVLYVRNVKESVTEEKLKELFDKFGELDRVKKVRDYAFIHFNERENAIKAMEEMNGTEVEGVTVDISLAKPQADRGKREKMRSERDRRQSTGRGGPIGAREGGGRGGMPVGRGGYGYADYYGGGPPGGRGRGQRGRAPPPPPPRSAYHRQDYGYGYDYGGYGDYNAGYGYGYDAGDPYYGGYGGDYYGGYDDYYQGGYAPGYDDYYGGYGPPMPPVQRRGGGGSGYTGGGRSQRGSRGRGGGGGRGGSGRGGGNRGAGGRPFSRGQKRKMESGGGDAGSAKRMNEGGMGGGYAATVAEPSGAKQDWAADVDPNFG